MSKELQRFTHVNSQTGELVEADVDLSDLAQLNRPDFRFVLQARMELDEQEVLAGDA